MRSIISVDWIDKANNTVDYCNFPISSVVRKHNKLFVVDHRLTDLSAIMKSVIFEDVVYEVPEKRGFGEYSVPTFNCNFP